MKRILFTFLFLAAFLAGYTQLQNNGGTITVENGATLVIEGDYTSTNAGSIEIDGNVQLKGDFVNNGGNVAAGSTGLLKFNGTLAQEITGSQSTTFACAVEVDNAAGLALTATQTGADQVMGAVTLTNGDVTLNAFDLTVTSVAGADASKHMVTNSTGELKAAVAAADFVFPVGDGTTYNPVTLNEAGAADTYGVIFTGARPAGWAGATHAVAANWAVTEVTAGGSNLSVTPQWNGAQEEASFVRADCAVGVTTDDGATIAWKASGAAAGTDPYTRAGAGFANVGKFVVGDYYYEGVEVDLDFFLAGPYAGGAMGIQLKTKNLIPLTDPYGLGTTVAAIPANVVDWVKVELRDKTNRATILYSRAFFLDNTGNVLYKDGTSGAKFVGIPKDQYYIAVKHRNHLGACTDATVDLNGVAPAFNYKSGAGVYTNPAYTYTPQFQVATGVYGLYKGNVNGDTRVAKTGAASINDMSQLLSYLGSSTSILNVYAGADVNCDGDVRKIGAAGINDMSHLLGSLGTFTSKFQHFTP